MGTDRRDRVAAMHAEFRELSTKLGHIREVVAALEATADGTDGCVRVTVGARGELARLAIAPWAVHRFDADQLADQIVATSTRAEAALRERTQAVVGTLPAVALPTSVLSWSGAGVQGDVLHSVLREAGGAGALGGWR